MEYPFQKMCKGEFKGWFREDLIPFLPRGFFSNPVAAIQRLESQQIKASQRRWAAIFTLPIGRVFLKRDKTNGLMEYLKYVFLPSKARKEWLIAYQFEKRGLAVPKSMGWMERRRWGLVKESYYFAEAIGSGVSIIEFSQPWEGSAILALGKNVKTFHEAGLFHKDLHGGNLVWDGKSYFLTDLHRTTIVHSLSLGQRLWNLSQLFHSMRSQWSNEDCIKFLEGYFEGELPHLQQKEIYFQKILSEMERLQKSQWKSRTKRCLKNSTEFSVTRARGMITYCRRNVSPDRLQNVLMGHHAVVKEKPSSLLKHSSEVIVSIIKEGKEEICVKQFLYPHFLDRFKEKFRRSKGLKAWIAGNGLKARGLPCLDILAYVEKKKGFRSKEGFLMMEAFTRGLELDRFLLKGFHDLQKRRSFIRAFARWLSRFHKMGLYHKDMKTCNLFIQETETGWSFYPLDLEDVRLDEKTNERGLFRNLLQINTSVPQSITRTDRYRFYKEYHRSHPIIKNHQKFLYRLIQKSRERGIVYVSPQGTVKEERC